MIIYQCDGCTKPITYRDNEGDSPYPVYELTVRYGPDATRSTYYHWDCLRKYMNEA